MALLPNGYYWVNRNAGEPVPKWVVVEWGGRVGWIGEGKYDLPEEFVAAGYVLDLPIEAPQVG